MQNNKQRIEKKTFTSHCRILYNDCLFACSMYEGTKNRSVFVTILPLLICPTTAVPLRNKQLKDVGTQMG